MKTERCLIFFSLFRHHILYRIIDTYITRSENITFVSLFGSSDIDHQHKVGPTTKGEDRIGWYMEESAVRKRVWGGSLELEIWNVPYSLASLHLIIEFVLYSYLYLMYTEIDPLCNSYGKFGKVTGCLFKWLLNDG